MVQPTWQKMSLKEAHESFSSTSRGPVHEDRRLQIEELNEWRTHKPRTPDKLKLYRNEPDTSPNQLTVSDKVLLDAVDPHIVTTTPNEKIPLTVLSILPFRYGGGPQEELFQILQVRPLIAGHHCINWAAVEQVQMADAIRTLLTTDPWELFFEIIEPTCFELTMELCSTFHLQIVMINYNDPGTIQFCLVLAHFGPYVNRLVRHFGLLNTAAQESFLTLIGQMSPEGISSMLSMRMVERHRGTYPPQYRLS
ncbi:hypothetical protein GOBAR_AA10778 [Gossypium barbadense]|uniref:Uncharacterized protein n=1 Tax=Gossypium barbadense TaxID=3634 RepID=A0A2P5Y2N9_GOSBA|nr:hypothetical protein GOBAR_AA10778 [Gossypium barbadense]